MSREQSYTYLLEEKERASALFDKISSVKTFEELAIYLCSPDDETRWIAKWRYKQLEALYSKTVDDK